MKKIDLRNFPKLKLINSPSDIYHLQQISKILGVDIYIKRDDLLPLGFGGNKLRKLEYLLGEAHHLKATHIFTFGAIQSNHARMTAIAAKKYGFEVELFLKKSVPINNDNYFQNGNTILNAIIEATIHQVSDNKSAYALADIRKNELEQEGYKPYLIPIGGSNALGTLGYVDCFYEILQQQNSLGFEFDYITTATGSGGTHAGLILGKLLSKSSSIVKAYNVEPEEDEIIAHTIKIGTEALGLCGANNILTQKDVNLSSEYAGKAYGIPEDYHIDTIKFLAKHEGIFLDPVYTSKAFTGLIMDIKNNVIKKGEKVLYIHTGGVPGIFAYPQFF